MSLELVRTKEELPEHDINEKYDIEYLLGRGVYGSVYHVLCKRTRQTLALKAINKSEVTFNNFKRELNYSYFLAAHPTIVTTYNVAFQTCSRWVFVQEIGPLGALSKTVTEGTGIGLEPTKIVIKQIADALQFMHSNKLSHGDIKPDNVLLFNRLTWTVKLTDFGLTCKFNTQVRKFSSNNVFTPPEVCKLIRNECYEVSDSGDVWQVGITMYHLLTGSLPWTEADSNSDLSYNAFLKWRQYTRSQLPNCWQQFNNKLLKLFTKLLNPIKKDRCGINDIYKYLKADWSMKAEKHEDVTACDQESWITVTTDSDDGQRAEAKATLQNFLSQYGVKTKISRTYKKRRVEAWLDDLRRGSV